MLGENKKALERLESEAGRSEVRPGWSAQSVPLMTADIYLLAVSL